MRKSNLIKKSEVSQFTPYVQKVKQKFQNNFLKTEIHTFRLVNQQKVADALFYTENLLKTLQIDEGEVIFLDLLSRPKNRIFQINNSVETQLSTLIYNCAIKTAQIYLQGPSFGGIFTNRIGILMRLLRQKNEQHSFVHNYLIRDIKKIEYAIQALMPVLRLDPVNLITLPQRTKYTLYYETLTKLLHSKQFYQLPVVLRLRVLEILQSTSKEYITPVLQNQVNYVFTPTYTWNTEWLQRPKVLLIFGSIANQQELIEFRREGLFIINFILEEPQVPTDQVITLDKNNLPSTFCFFINLFKIIKKTKSTATDNSVFNSKRILFQQWNTTL